MASPCTTATTGSGQSSIARSMTSMPLALPSPTLLRALGHVEAGAEHVALAADHQNAILGRDRRLQGLDHVAQQLAVERVLFSGRFIQTVLTGPFFSMMTLLMALLTPVRCRRP